MRPNASRRLGHERHIDVVADKFDIARREDPQLDSKIQANGEKALRVRRTRGAVKQVLSGQGADLVLVSPLCFRWVVGVLKNSNGPRGEPNLCPDRRRIRALVGLNAKVIRALNVIGVAAKEITLVMREDDLIPVGARVARILQQAAD